jgi:putative membrane protein (TIGR04086 family)
MKNPLMGQISAEGRNEERGGMQIKALLRGLAASLLLVVVLSFALAAAYCFTSLSAPAAHLMRLGVLLLSALAGGFLAAKSAGSRGMLHGLLLGALLLLLLVIYNMLGGTGGVSGLTLAVKALLMLAGGGIGGILGII